MRIQRLKLFTSKLDAEKEFYSEILGFELIEQAENYFTLKVGWTELSFERSKEAYKYHYCFLIPSNKLMEAMDWMEERVDLIDLGDGRKVERYETWNADSFYFYDASGNIAEFIVRYDLDNAIDSIFEGSDVLCVNEIGMPTDNVAELNHQLKENFGTQFWKGDLERFATNGSQEGLFLLPNYRLKDSWFPTMIKPRPVPFNMTLINNNEVHCLEYRGGKIGVNAFQ